ncbi:hypothetical protein GPALN_012857 [Globodera pallida]|nr:hypothetical protein GPALN_012857 [Globodera pallida]
MHKLPPEILSGLVDALPLDSRWASIRVSSCFDFFVFKKQHTWIWELKNLQQQLIGQETHIHSQETHIHSQDTRIRRQDTRIRRQEQRLGIQEQRLGMQEQRLGMQEQRLGMQQMWITELRSRIVQLERAENEQQRTSASSHRTTPTGAAQSLEPFVPFEYQPQQQSQENASATVQQAIVQTGQSFGSSVPFQGVAPSSAGSSAQFFTPQQPQLFQPHGTRATVQQAIVQTGQSFGSSVPFQGVAPSSAGTSAQFFTPQQPPQHPPPHGMNPHYHPYHRSGPPIAKFSAQKNIGSTSEQFAPLNITTQAHEHFHRGQWTPAPNAPIEDGRGGLANNAAGFKF